LPIFSQVLESTLAIYWASIYLENKISRINRHFLFLTSRGQLDKL